MSHTAQLGGAELALGRLLGRERVWQAALCAPPGGAFDGLPRHGVTLDESLPALPTGGTRGRSPVLAAQYLAALRAASRVLRRSAHFAGADIIHANTAAAGIISALAVRGSGTRLVLHLRDLVTTESLGQFGYLAFTRIALGRASGIIANSQTTLGSAHGLFPAGVPTAVLPSPIGIQRPATPPTVRPTVRTIGMIGRLQHWKGQHIFLRAFADQFRGTDTRGLIAGAPLFGETAYAEELRRLAADLGIAEQVTFLGQIDDVAGFLDSIDLLVHASLRPEPLGQTVVQGLARAKPVIATEGGGPSEWIRDGINGLLVVPGQPEALAASMRKMADSPELRSALTEGAMRTTGILTDDECMTAHGDLFRQVWHADPPTARRRSK
ncbi:glycosyltransferase family 4 protein [Polymorphospora rubra]|uniref:glycosyltransferase family 4 protein n=1 Tax=Polymorphospora rubra TaxID=338584 RepID=UPI0033CD5E8C